MTTSSIHILYGILAVACMGILLLRTILILAVTKKKMKEMKYNGKEKSKSEERFIYELSHVYPLRYLYLSLSFAGHVLALEAFKTGFLSWWLVPAGIAQIIAIVCYVRHVSEDYERGIAIPYFILGNIMYVLFLVLSKVSLGSGFHTFGLVVVAILFLLGFVVQIISSKETRVGSIGSFGSTTYSSDSSFDEEDEGSSDDDEEKSIKIEPQKKQYTRVYRGDRDLIYTIEGDRSSAYIREPYGDIRYKIKYDSIYDAYGKFLFEIRGNELVDGAGWVQYTISDSGVVRGYHGNYVCTLKE